MNKFSLTKTLKNDYGVFFLTIGCGVSLILMVLISSLGASTVLGDSEEIGLNTLVDIPIAKMLLGISVMLFFLLLARVLRLKETLRNGIRLEAEILVINFESDRGRIDFRYFINDKEIITGVALMKNKQTVQFVYKPFIEVVIDPTKESRAYIAELYEKEKDF